MSNKACGVCSDTIDLAVNMLPDLYAKSYECALIPDPSLMFECYLRIGFTSECAWLWMNNAVNTAISCTEICLENQGMSPNDPITCALNPCLSCDQTYSESIFKPFSGRTRRRSGIITQVIRDCSSIANIEQDPCA